MLLEITGLIMVNFMVNFLCQEQKLNCNCVSKCTAALWLIKSIKVTELFNLQCGLSLNVREC